MNQPDLLVAIVCVQAPFSADAHLMRLTDAAGAEDHSTITGLAILPCSRLLMVAAAGGVLKIIA